MSLNTSMKEEMYEMYQREAPDTHTLDVVIDSETGDTVVRLFGSNWYLGFLPIAILIAIYTYIILYIFKNRSHQATLPRSPYMIMLCGCALFMDSLINCVIQMMQSSNKGGTP